MAVTEDKFYNLLESKCLDSDNGYAAVRMRGLATKGTMWHTVVSGGVPTKDEAGARADP
jgi:hypothetical protein